MTWFRRDRCGTHQGSLLEFAARRAGGQEVGRALDHVEACERCAHDLAATALILHALRRLHDETLLAEPAADGWERLRLRLQARRRRSSRLRSGLPGVALAFFICALVTWPAGMGRAAPVVPDGYAEPASPDLGMPRTSVDAAYPDAAPAAGQLQAAPMLVVIGHGGVFDAHTPGARAQSVRAVDSLAAGSSPVDDPSLYGHPAPLVGFVDATRR